VSASAIATLVATAVEVDGALSVAGMTFRREFGRWHITADGITARVAEPAWLAALDGRVAA
jgi:hypothetical protein